MVYAFSLNLLVGCVGPTPNPTVRDGPLELVVVPSRRWFGHHEFAFAGSRLIVGPFGAGGSMRIVTSAPSALIDVSVGALPGRLYSIDPLASDGDLSEVADFFEDDDTDFGAACLGDLGDLDGDGVHEIGVCGLHNSFVLRGPLGPQSELLVRIPRQQPGGGGAFVVRSIERLRGSFDGILLAGSGLMARYEFPLSAVIFEPTGPSPDVIQPENGQSPLFPTGDDVTVLDDRRPEVYAFGMVGGLQLDAIGLFHGWPDSRSFDEAVQLGTPVSGRLAKGDVDGDGLLDLLLLTPNLNRVTVITDPDLKGELVDAHIVLHGERLQPLPGGSFLSPGLFGIGVDVGDLNHDGFDDVVVGMPGNFSAQADPGGVVVFLGPLTAGVYTLEDADLIVHDSSDLNDRFGTNPRIADLDGDGLMDLVVGSPSSDGPWGEQSGMLTAYFNLFGSLRSDFD